MGLEVKTVDQLLKLDRDEVREGYRAYDQALKPNASQSFFHGWRTARIDKGLLPIDQSYRDLNSDLVAYYAGTLTFQS